VRRMAVKRKLRKTAEQRPWTRKHDETNSDVRITFIAFDEQSQGKDILKMSEKLDIRDLRFDTTRLEKIIFYSRRFS